MSAPKTARTWIDLHHENTAGVTTVYRWATDDLGDGASYEGGWKEGRLVSVGPIERRIADVSGEHHLASAAIQFDDTDRLWRAVLDTDATSYVDGRDVVIKTASDAQRAAAGAATILMRGVLRETPLADGLGGGLEIEEKIGSAFGPVPFDRPVPQRTFRREIFPDLHVDLLDQVVPIIYGEVSDAGTIDAAGNDASKGLCPGFYTGDVLLSSSAVVTSTSPVTTTLPPPILQSATVSGTPGTRTYHYAITAATATGQTTLSNVLTVTNGPDPLTTTNKVTLVWTLQDMSVYDQVRWFGVWCSEVSTSGPWYRLDTMNNGGTFTDPELTYDDDGDDSHFKAYYGPPPNTNTATVSTTLTVNGTATTVNAYGRIVFAGHAGTFLNLYGSDGGASGDPSRVEWTLGGMSDVIDPTHANWPHADPFVDITGTDGVTERFLCIYVYGPRLTDHVEGRVTIAANICGCPQDAGDPDTATITQAPRVWQHFLSEWVFGNSGKGYYTGAWAGLPTFADGTEVISASTVSACVTQTATFLGDATGYLAGFCLAAPITVRDFLRAFNQTFTTFSYTNTHGQLCLSVVNTSADPASGTLIREDIDDVQGIGAPREDKRAVENRIRYRFDYDSDAQAYRSDLREVKDDASRAAHKGWREREEYALRLTRHAATAADAMNRRLLLLTRAPVYVPVTMGLSGRDLDLFSQVRITAHEGLGASGYSARPGLIVGRTDLPDEGAVRLDVWDLGRVWGQSFGVQSGSGLTWGDWSTTSETWDDWTTTTTRWGG